jgi:two-component system, OmpR family, response regulator
MQGKRRRAKILIIDDQPIILAQARGALTQAGYEVVGSQSPIGNGRHLADCSLVLIDFLMPGFDGASVLSNLRHAAGPGTDCLFYLYTSCQEIADAWEDYGFDGCIRDKGDANALVAQIRWAVASGEKQAPSPRCSAGSDSSPPGP